MQPIADLLIDRKRLKARLSGWRIAALVLLFGLFASLLGTASGPGGPIPNSYIAQIHISDVMVDDEKRDALMKEIRDDNSAKALIVQFDSPGGTTFGGETLYLQLKEISAKKPVIGVMRTLCASACYMASLGTDYVVAREGTLTGSIGVLLQSMEISRLVDKLGITPITIKSGAMKDVPSLSEPISEEERAIVAETVTDAYNHFVRLIVERRKMDQARVRQLADGRIYTGTQAQKLGLIDGIGGTDEAIKWLEKEKKIAPNLKIHEFEPKPELESLWGDMAESMGIKIFGRNAVGLDGLVSIWHPSLIQ